MSNSRSIISPPPKKITAVSHPDASRTMIIFLGTVAALYFGREVLVPLTLALLLTFILGPLVSLLRKFRLGRVPSVLVSMLIALGIILAIGGMIGTQISELSSNIPEYSSTIESKISHIRAYTLGRVTDFAHRVGVQPPALDSHYALGVAPKADISAASQPTSAQRYTPLDLAQRYLSPVLSPLGTLGIVIIIAIFALLQQEDLRDRLIRLMGSSDLHRTTIAIDDAGQRLSRYFMSQLAINSAFGVVIGIGLLIIGVPSPVLFGILSALLRFVPYVGALVSALLPLSLAAAIDPGWSLVMWTGLLYLVVEGLTGQWIEPMTYGNRTGLSPFSVVVAALFWSWIWGPIGLILSTPLTLCLVVVGRHSKSLEFLDVMLGDRPALTPVESLYQRIFAGDVDETQDHAELLLKEMSLVDYYDSVMIRALQLAAADMRRGVLNDDQEQRVCETVMALIHDLDDYDDKHLAGKPKHRPGSSRIDALPLSVTAAGELASSFKKTVICIAGRGPYDGVTAAAFAQLLQKHGIPTIVMVYDDASREKLDEIDFSNIALVCVACLDVVGGPAHLRKLTRRLRLRLPHTVPILMGFWPAKELEEEGHILQEIIGADHLASSLKEMIASSMAALTQDADDTRPIKTSKNLASSQFEESHAPGVATRDEIL